MKVIIYISGILGVILITLGLIGSHNNAEGSDSVLLLGLALVIALCLPLIIFRMYEPDRKIKEIIEGNKYIKSDAKKKQRLVRKSQRQRVGA